jgi:putative transposase
MNEITDTSALSLLPGSTGYDLIEDRLRASVRATIETLFEEELAEFLGRMC